MAAKYRVEIECVYSWVDYVWMWRVFDEFGDVSWHGDTNTKWGAKRQARRAVRKLSQGILPPGPKPAVETLWL